MSVLQFEPMKSAVDVTFWSELGDLKLNIWRLSEERVNLQGSSSSTLGPGMPAFIQLEHSSFTPSAKPPAQTSSYVVPGTLQNFNTEKGFQDFDKVAALKEAGHRIWQNIVSGAAEEHPMCLGLFVLLTYADLKKYIYWFRFASPALKPPEPFKVSSTKTLEQHFEAEAETVATACDTWRAAAKDEQATSSSSTTNQIQWPFWLLVKDDAGSWTAEPLTAHATVAESGREYWLCMADPSNLPDHPGWPLRNMLLMAAKRWHVRNLSVLCVRDRRGKADAQRSLALSVILPEIAPDWEPSTVVGWEANSNGKLTPHRVDLGPSMDPHRLAQSAVTLNVSLMRWRAAPSLGIDRLQDLKILLLGAGTLGCAVARVLLGWGVRHIDFVDNSNVAFSNPVRQSLFEFEDCLHGGKPKAQAAADKLRQIYPGAVSQGFSLSIPMPGHPVAPSQLPQVQADTERLADLIADHDVVFELMDTRESRWLPTLLAAAEGKMVINAALGFDSFLVMRHGAPPQGKEGSEPQQGRGKRLGCYFCNDVVAPLNSTVDRTLEQQCTVARPGLASIAGGVAVELMASTLQHPEGMHAPAAVPGEQFDQDSLPLGPVPHMVRGQLSGFSQMCLTGQAFQQCTACSPTVVEQYKQHGWSFLQQALHDPKMLEDLTGLAKLHAETEARSKLADEKAGDVAQTPDEADSASIPDIDDWTEL